MGNCCIATSRCVKSYFKETVDRPLRFTVIWGKVKRRTAALTKVLMSTTIWWRAGMSFYEIESGFTTMLQGVDRKAADRAAFERLKSKLLELRDCGLDLEMPSDLHDLPDDIGGVLATPARDRGRLT
jgi:hypothetical protein